MVDGYFKKLGETTEEGYLKLHKHRQLAIVQALEAQKLKLNKKYNQTPSDVLWNQITVLEKKITYEQDLSKNAYYALFCKHQYDEYTRLKIENIEIQDWIDLNEGNEDMKQELLHNLKSSKRREEEAKKAAEIDLRQYLDSQVRPECVHTPGADLAREL